jgi:hypothetical protein
MFGQVINNEYMIRNQLNNILPFYLCFLVSKLFFLQNVNIPELRTTAKLTHKERNWAKILKTCTFLFMTGFILYNTME